MSEKIGEPLPYDAPPIDVHVAGWEDTRATLLAGLKRIPDGSAKNIPGNYLMGAFQAIVRIVFENRATGIGQSDVVIGLATLMGDEIAGAAAEVGDTAPIAGGGGQGLVNAFTAALRAWAPRDENQRSVIDTRAVLDAVAYFAALQISSLPNQETRGRATAMFAEAVGTYCVRLAPYPTARKI